jgi:hypothetical protein
MLLISQQDGVSLLSIQNSLPQSKGKEIEEAIGNVIKNCTLSLEKNFEFRLSFSFFLVAKVLTQNMICSLAVNGELYDL